MGKRIFTAIVNIFLLMILPIWVGFAIWWLIVIHTYRDGKDADLWEWIKGDNLFWGN